MKNIIYILLFFTIVSSKAQLVQPGIDLGMNLTNVYEPNTNESMGGYFNKKPFIGGFAGGFVRVNYAKRRFLKSSLVFENRTVLSGSDVLVDNDGNPKGIVQNRRISNNYLNLKIDHYFKASKVVSFGIGLNNHFLLYSKTHFIKDLMLNNNQTTSPSSFRNYYYKTYWLSIPVSIHFDIKRTSIWLTYDKSLMSRITKKALFKEFEDCIQIGISYRFNYRKE